MGFEYGTDFSRGRFAAGTYSVPSISFLSDPNTGFYLSAADSIGVSAGGVVSSIFINTGQYVNALYDLAGGGGRYSISLSAFGLFTSGVADGASAIAHRLNTANALSTAGASLLSVENSALQKFYVDKDGAIYSAAGVFISSTSGYSTYFAGNVVSNGTAIANQFGNINALTTAGDKIASFYSDNRTTQKMYIDKDGLPAWGATVANSTGTVAIVGRDTNLLVANTGWKSEKLLDGTVIYQPYWT